MKYLSKKKLFDLFDMFIYSYDEYISYLRCCSFRHKEISSDKDVDKDSRLISCFKASVFDEVRFEFLENFYHIYLEVCDEN